MKQCTNYQFRSDLNVEFSEARGFAEAMKMYAAGFDGDTFFCRQALNKAAEVINMLCDFIASSKETEEGKERHSPHTPYREKGKKGKKAASTAARGRAREVEFQPPPRESVVAYAKGKNIPETFVDYWLECMNTNYSPAWFDCVTQTYITAWRKSLIAYWINAAKDKIWLDFERTRNAEKEATRKPRRYSLDEWALCDERCRHFDAKLCRCRCGCAVPPDKRPSPLPPEECERFGARKEVA